MSGKVKRKNNKTIFKGELGYGTKKKALDDMGKDNLDFDALNDMFHNESQLVNIPENVDNMIDDIDWDE